MILMAFYISYLLPVTTISSANIFTNMLAVLRASIRGSAKMSNSIGDDVPP
jgi:hypothetical protein